MCPLRFVINFYIQSDLKTRRIRLPILCHHGPQIMAHILRGETKIAFSIKVSVTEIS